MIAALVFDFDGVLADSEPIHLRAYQETLEPFGRSLPREEYYASYLGYNDYDMFKALAEARGWPLDRSQIDALIATKGRIYDSLVAGGDHLYPGVAQAILRLAAQYPLGIASGALRHEIEAILRARGLDRHFRFVVASGDTPASKPAPDPYAKAAALHGVPPSQCLAIEDSRWGIASAKTAGLWCVGITNTYPVSELLDADAIITSLDELTPELIGSIG